MSIASNSVRKSQTIAKKALSDEALGAVSVIRGLISSRKRITTLRDVEKEYLELEGQPIAFSKWGFNSSLEFLRASGEFHTINKKNNDEEVRDSRTHWRPL